ncbi:MAG TPA: caspase family protein [Methyloceanibacter sp.]|nr:caspase family protein [Methyloceanibacter sp.]
MRRGACLAFGLAVMTAVCVCVHAAPAFAAKRVALVIGNNTYENVPALKKAVNDAGAISEELAKLGFDVVSAENVGRRAMSRALVELESKIENGDTALMYFAGHALPSTAPTTSCRSVCPKQAQAKRASYAMPLSQRAASRTGCRRRAPRP